MGIESDQLVFDYLSRVGDLAQQRQLSSGTRMQLVSSLRNEIDRQRAKYGTDSPAAVQHILGRLGSPDEVVDGASPEPGRRPSPEGTVGTEPAAGTAPASVPEQRSGTPEAGAVEASAGPATPGTVPGAREPEWWRIERGRPDEAGFGAFVGGVEVPDLLRPPRKDEEDGERGAGGPERQGTARRRRFPRWRRAGAAGAPGSDAASGGTGASAGAPPVAPAPSRGGVRLALGNPMVLFAAMLLAAGAVLGSLVALAGGWLLAYATRALSRTEAKFAVLGIPGLVAASAAVWIWGRVEGRWGDPIAPGGDAMREALTGAWPWVVRGAAVASALFLLWRARRR
ncbi:hypothetical protein QMZ92_16675 [Streptomyces sp. HNM0645]|uniref:hypothetical protein n=1 Tax=Streptomyces sp. HNM0645 TaxID=2782343 RepID=UPI0024B7B7C1|nr:hypothetical protein [Streptomyces sp. HNM0645]MDI9885969.1 hypothetical protein [Streptomyces sp. HNM0645]